MIFKKKIDIDIDLEFDFVLQYQKTIQYYYGMMEENSEVPFRGTQWNHATSKRVTIWQMLLTCNRPSLTNGSSVHPVLAPFSFVSIRMWMKQYSVFSRASHTKAEAFDSVSDPNSDTHICPKLKLRSFLGVENHLM